MLKKVDIADIGARGPVAMILYVIFDDSGIYVRAENND